MGRPWIVRVVGWPYTPLHGPQCGEGGRASVQPARCISPHALRARLAVRGASIPHVDPSGVPGHCVACLVTYLLTYYLYLHLQRNALRDPTNAHSVIRSPQPTVPGDVAQTCLGPRGDSARFSEI